MKFQFKSSVKLAKENTRIKEVAEKLGIILPSSHTALFESVFAKLEEPNGNKVRLHKKVGETVKQMIGAQANLEHRGENWIVGIILDAWLEDNGEINIIYSFAKNIYKDEYVRALEEMSEGSLSVSFELLANHEDIEHLADGTILLNDVDWQGVGVLIEADPAYKSATTYEVASLYKTRAEECKELVFASQIIEKCDKILNQKNEGENVMADEKTEDIVQTSEEIQAEETETKVEDIKTEEVQAEEAEEVKAEMKKISDERFTTTVTYKDDGSTEVASEKECVYKWMDSEGNEQTETIKEKTDVFHMISEKEKSETEAKIAELEAQKAEYEARVSEQEKVLAEKDEELNVFKAEKEAIAQAEKEAKLTAIKEELKDNPYSKDFSEEDYFNAEKVEIAKIRQENDELKAKVKVEAKVQDNDIEAGTPEVIEAKTASSILRGKLK